MTGLTLDTGALLAFERSDRRIHVHLKNAHLLGQELTIPTPVIAEAWRGGVRSARIARLLDASVVEPLLEELARTAGEALGSVKGAGAIDAIVMASAARRGDRVLTSDFDDMDRLRAYFPAVRVLRV
jgi:predicted nucleic acid-binding protein